MSAAETLQVRSINSTACIGHRRHHVTRLKSSDVGRSRFWVRDLGDSFIRRAATCTQTFTITVTAVKSRSFTCGNADAWLVAVRNRLVKSDVFQDSLSLAMPLPFPAFHSQSTQIRVFHASTVIQMREKFSSYLRRPKC